MTSLSTKKRVYQTIQYILCLIIRMVLDRKWKIVNEMSMSSRPHQTKMPIDIETIYFQQFSLAINGFPFLKKKHKISLMSPLKSSTQPKKQRKLS
jgi:hypothetical protein